MTSLERSWGIKPGTLNCNFHRNIFRRELFTMLPLRVNTLPSERQVPSFVRWGEVASIARNEDFGWIQSTLWESGLPMDFPAVKVKLFSPAYIWMLVEPDIFDVRVIHLTTPWSPTRRWSRLRSTDGMKPSGLILQALSRHLFIHTRISQSSFLTFILVLSFAIVGKNLVILKSSMPFRRGTRNWTID